MTRFNNRYRTESSRLPGWDYGSPGRWYLVTICTKNREPHFGVVEDGQVRLTPIGVMARQFWNDIPLHFDAVQLDRCVVMPDHLHGLILIEGTKAALHPGVGRRDDPAPSDTLAAGPAYMSKISPLPGTLPVVVRSFKSALTRWCGQNGYPLFSWQERYHDRLVEPDELPKARAYIVENPRRWEGVASGASGASGASAAW